MRWKLILAIVCCAASATSLRADELKPISGPPSVDLAIASKATDDPSRVVVSLVLVHYERVIHLEPRRIEVEGVATSRFVEVEEIVPVTTYINLSEGTEIRRASGAIMRGEEILRALAKQTRVVVFSDKFDSYYADLLKPETIVLVRSEPNLRPTIAPGPPATYGPQTAPSNSSRVVPPTTPLPGPTFAPSTAP